MTDRTARAPFHFHGCWELHEMLGRRAYDERELLEHLEDVPLDSIYFHTHGCFLRERTFPGAYPNDFATWAAIQVRDRVLGEKLGIVDPLDFAAFKGRKQLGDDEPGELKELDKKHPK